MPTRRRRVFVLVSAVVWTLTLAAAAQTPPAGAFVPPPAPEQPLPYSHRTHLAQEAVGCALCHATAATADAASLPPTATCMTCHATVRAESPAIRTLTAAHAAREEIAWRRVYRLPSYVYFSHQVHVTAGRVDCAVCHGNVRDLAVMQKLKDTRMATCVECHQASGAPTACDSCHEPRE
jgi:hypothetical protein